MQEFCPSPLHAKRSLLEWLYFYFWDCEFYHIWLEVMVSHLLPCSWQSRLKRVLKLLGEINYGASGDSEWGALGGYREGELSPPRFKACYLRLLTKCILKAWNEQRWCGGGLGLFDMDWERIARRACQLKYQRACVHSAQYPSLAEQISL